MSKKIVNNLFHYAARENAGSLTIESTPENILLNYNLPDGEEQNFILPKKLESDLLNNLRQILKIAPEELTQQKYCKVYDKNYRLTFRLTILPTDSGEKIIINIVKRNHKLHRIKQLGLQKNELGVVRKALRSKSGLIIISSPSGNGKSTTLYSLLQELNQPERNIYLMEKNPEHKLDGVNQLPPSKNNWDKILQHDSDIVVLDDIESNEDFKRVFQAANSGRLVMASITANSSWEVLLKILQLKLPLSLRLNNLKLIINQRTVKLKRNKDPKKVFREEIGLFEALNLNQAMKDFILNSKNDPQKKNFWETLARLALENNFQPLSKDLQQKIKDGLIDLKYYK